MRRTILAAMIMIFVLICCVSSSWAFWPFTGDDQRKTHESLDVVIEAGAETAKEARDASRDTRADISKAKKEIRKDLQRGLRGLTEEIKKANIAHKDANIKPILIVLGLTLVVILIVILIMVIVFSRKKFPEGNSVKFPPTEQGGKCSICSRTVKPENWKRHLRRSVCKESGEKMGKKVELILA